MAEIEKLVETPHKGIVSALTEVDRAMNERMNVTQVMTLEELEMIAELCRKHDVIVVSDEVYEWLVYPPNQHIRIGQQLLFRSGPDAFSFISNS